MKTLLEETFEFDVIQKHKILSYNLIKMTSNLNSYLDCKEADYIACIAKKASLLDQDRLYFEITPFLLHSLIKLYHALKNEVKIPISFLHEVLINFIDSYVHYLDDAFQIEIEDVCLKVLILPKIELKAHVNSGYPLILKKTNNHVDVYQEGLRTAFSGSLSKNKSKSFPLNIRILFPELSTSESMTEIENTQNSNEFDQAIKDSCSIIRGIDKNLSSKIELFIKYVYPITTPSQDIHNSFSSYDFPGIIFLSMHKIPLVLGEAIIHEFYHNEMNVFMQIDCRKLFHENKKEFYSPWRNDPRPIFGLLHAIYVFTGILLFYDKYYSLTQKSSIFSIILSIYFKLTLALSQITDQDLTDHGILLINSITSKLETLFEKYQLSRYEVPSDIKKHIQHWEKINHMRIHKSENYLHLKLNGLSS